MFENARAYSGFAVDDVDKSHEFYVDELGLDVSEALAGVFLNLPGDRETLVYHKPDFTPAGAWFTDPAGNIICVHEPMPAST
jgi:hypothetical protein